jgi:hypothetical protein
MQKTTVLRKKPSFLEITAFAYFPGSFLIGPQFSMRRYLDYVNGKLVETVCYLKNAICICRPNNILTYYIHKLFLKNHYKLLFA